MKRLALIGSTILVLLTGCSATTITEREGNYIYRQDENIYIQDIDTRNRIGTLKIIGASSLKSEPFVVQEISGVDTSGNPIYQDVVYEQLVQIWYLYDSKDDSKELYSSNFSVYDAQGDLGEVDPKVEYSSGEGDTRDSFLVALKNRSDFIRLHFRYNPLQTTVTAKIELELSDGADGSTGQGHDTEQSVNVETSQRVSVHSTRITETQVQNADEERNHVSPLILYGIIGILIFVIFILTAVVIIQYKNKKDRD